MADPAGNNILYHVPPELLLHRDYPMAPWSFDPSPCSLLMMVSLSLTLAEKYLTLQFYITIFHIKHTFNIKHLESASNGFKTVGWSRPIRGSSFSLLLTAAPDSFFHVRAGRKRCLHLFRFMFTSLLHVPHSYFPVKIKGKWQFFPERW